MSASLQVELRSVTPAVKQSGIMKKKICNICRLQSSSRGTYGISNYNYDEIIKVSESARFMASKYIGLFVFATTVVAKTNTTVRNCESDQLYLG